ncbi:MAG: class I SAM-dependent methyltransferase, partial [Myxococcales bacterium]|nr:class I SAM-dependent methyltransferase [Myxococcales bacterium]
MSSSQLVSDSRERDFAAGHAIAELEFELAGGLDSLASASTREPLASELAALDRAFAELAKLEVREVLELGCGLGTLLIPLLRRGLWVTGLDLQREAVDSCRRRVAACGLSTRIDHGDARTLTAETEYDAALLMRGLLSLLPGEDAQLEALRRARRAVRPGGLVIVDHRNLLAMWSVFGRKLLRREHLADGRELELGRQATIISFEGRVHERRWARLGERLYEQHDHLRITTVSETGSLLRRAGLDVVHVEAHPIEALY